MWQVVTYYPNTLFSLRPHNATTSGGKTLVTPTPFAFKMALLDAAIRKFGLATGIIWFPVIRDFEMAVRLPESLIVNNTFVKILRTHKDGARDPDGTGLVGVMGSNIAYRELVYFDGKIEIAIRYPYQLDNEIPLLELCSGFNYLGKRGGFFQLISFHHIESLPGNYTILTQEIEGTFPVNGLLQLVDDCGPQLNFDDVNIYSGKNISLNKPKGRIIHTVVFPYWVVKSSRSFTLYRRYDPITG